MLFRSGISANGAGFNLGSRTNVSDILHSPEMAAAVPSLVQACKVFAGQMVRNAATIGGNIANGSPIGDSPPPLSAAGATLHPHGLAPPHPQLTGDSLVRSEARARDGGCRLERDVIRDPRGRMRGGNGIVGEPAGFSQVTVIEDPVAPAPFMDARPHRIDRPCDIEADSVRVAPVRVPATGEFVVDRVETDRMDGDANFAVSRSRYSQLTNAESVHGAGLIED